MTDIQFYHLTSTPIERALPRLLEKAMSGGFRVLVRAGSEEKSELLNRTLWTFNPDSFLPHGSAADPFPEQQPIYLTAGEEIPNQPNLVVAAHGASIEQPERFERILDLFDGQDVQAVEAARIRWAQYKQQGHSIGYNRQTPAGGWEKN